MTPPVAVIFEPSGLVAWVQPGTTVLEAARSVGITIPSPCGGRGICGSCGVRVVDGELAEADAAEAAGLKRAPAGVRLSCRARISSAVTVRPLVAYVARTAEPHAQGGESVAAVDLGTTTVAAAVVEAADGRSRCSAVVANRQQAWGSDVLARVSAALDGSADELRIAAVASMLEALETAAGDLAGITRLVVAGNTVMTSLLAGVGVESLAAHPFTSPELPSTLTEIAVTRRLPSAEVVLVPPIAAFVGGDTLAGLVHTGMLHAEAPQLLIDLGTNAEIALVHGGTIYVASAAAGPAFEGVGVECGGPAVAGAVFGVTADAEGEIHLETVDNAPATSFAGSGVISAIALLRGGGHVDAAGRLRAEGPFKARFFIGQDGVARLRFARDGERALTISQLDVRAVQLAKAAVQVGIARVLSAAGVRAAQLQAIYVAGAFGASLRPADLVSLGVIPRAGEDLVDFVGNASLEGALAIALEPEVLNLAVARTRGAVHVDLARDPGFSAALMDALSLEPFEA